MSRWPMKCMNKRGRAFFARTCGGQINLEEDVSDGRTHRIRMVCNRCGILGEIPHAPRDQSPTITDEGRPATDAGEIAIAILDRRIGWCDFNAACYRLAGHLDEFFSAELQGATLRSARSEIAVALDVQP